MKSSDRVAQRSIRSRLSFVSRSPFLVFSCIQSLCCFGPASYCIFTPTRAFVTKATLPSQTRIKVTHHPLWGLQSPRQQQAKKEAKVHPPGESMSKPNWTTLNKPTANVPYNDESNNTIEEKQQQQYEMLLSINEPWSKEQFESSLELYDQFMKCDDTYVSPLIKEALNCLDHAYRLYGPHSVVCSYNGGKDAVVILHLTRAAHANYYRDEQKKKKEKAIESSPPRPRVIYFEHENEFPEVLSLLHDTVTSYDLNMIAFEMGLKFSEGLEILVNYNIPPGANKVFPMAFILGTRSSDPNAGKQGSFAPSSHYMPPFMRVNPVLDWSYGHVWHFLRLFQLPYCSLYDQGYTSLGTTKDTLPCPALSVAGSSSTSGSGVPKYWPAYMLRDWDQERAGRIKKEKDKNKSNKKQAPSSPAKGGSVVGTTIMKKSAETFSQSSTIIDNESSKNGTIIPSVQVSAPETASNNASSVSIDSSEIDALSFINDDGRQKTVGLIIIGDEILKGRTADANTQAAAVALREHNVPLSRVVVVGDDQEEIVDEIQRMSRSDIDVIITSGGVGPTHDDVTIKSVAVALDRKMIFHEEMAQLLREKMNQDQDNENKNAELTIAQKKMATLPSNSKLRYLSDEANTDNEWPILQCHNIFVLPGVPQFFAKKIEVLAVYLSSQLERSATYKVVLSVDEASIVKSLNSAVDNHPEVIFGSYPFVSHPEFKTVLTLEGRMMPADTANFARNSTVYIDRRDMNESSQFYTKEQMDQHVQDALDDLIESLPKGSILRVDNDDGFVLS